MKLYWSIRSLPELVDLPEEERKEILKKCDLTNLEKIGVFWRFLMLPFLLAGVTLGETCGGRIGAILGVVIGGTIGFLVISQIPFYIIRSRIRKYLFTHGKFD